MLADSQISWKPPIDSISNGEMIFGRALMNQSTNLDERIDCLVAEKFMSISNISWDGQLKE